jgi:hypothetical protein
VTTCVSEDATEKRWYNSSTCLFSINPVSYLHSSAVVYKMYCNKFLKTYVLAAIMIIAAILTYVCIKDGHDWGDDFALYILQAKAIVNCSMYTIYALNKYSMQHSSFQISPYLYPNGFPLLLAPVYYFRGIDFVAMKMLCGFFFIASIPVLYLLFRRHFSNVFFAFFIGVLISFNPQFVTFSDSIGSDLPFFFFSLLSILLLSEKNSILNQVLLGASICFSYFIRDIGIMLIPMLLVFHAQQLFLKKVDKKRAVLFIIPYCIFICFFILVIICLPVGGENHYHMFFSNFLINQVGNKILYYLYFISRCFYIQIRYISLFLLIAFTGMLVTWKENLYIAVYVFLIVIILLIWPADQGVRFLFPIIPFIIFFIVKGILYLYNRFHLNIKYLVTGLSIYLVIVSFINVREVINYTKTDSNECYTAETKQIYNYIAAHIPEKEIIGFSKPRALRLFTNKNTIFTDEDHFAGSVATYLLISKKEYKLTNIQYTTIFQTKNFILLSK